MAAVRVRHDAPYHAAQVQACLATVVDPELDESVTELGFITEVELPSEGEVRVGFRLPTFWCAANFAFLMADDMRRALLELPWVTKVDVQLRDHMYAEAINQGVASGVGFQAAFGAAAEGGLEALRTTFLRKAFQRRQEALLQHLLDAGLEASQLVALSRSALRQTAPDAEGERLTARYMERRDQATHSSAGETLAFVDVFGHPIAADALPGYLRGLRSVGVNAEFNGALCRGLLAVRDGAGPAQLQAQPVHIVRPSAARIGMS